MRPWTLLSHILSSFPDKLGVWLVLCLFVSLELLNSVKLIDCITHLNQALLLSREMSQLCAILHIKCDFWDRIFSSQLHCAQYFVTRGAVKLCWVLFPSNRVFLHFARRAIFSASWSHLAAIHAWFEDNGKDSCYISLIWEGKCPHKWFHSSRYKRLFWSHFLFKWAVDILAVGKLVTCHW